MKAKVRLDTQKDIVKFVNIASKIQTPVYLTDGNNFTVSAKSLLGAIYTMEWEEIYLVCDGEHYHDFYAYII